MLQDARRSIISRSIRLMDGYRPHDDLAREQAQRGDWYEATGPVDRQEHVNLIWRLASRVRVGILLDDGLAHPAKAEDGGKVVVE